MSPSIAPIESDAPVVRRVAIVIQHVELEGTGLLGPILERNGFTLRHVQAGIDSLDMGVFADADLLVVLGGPIDVNDIDLYPFIDDELRTISAWLSYGRPTLGICLGAQMIAKALRAKVTRGAVAEFGFQPLTLTAAGRSSVLAPLSGIPALHWHTDIFEMPEDVPSLANTSCSANQAFAIVTHVLALHFHIEVESSQIERWLIGHANELRAHSVDPRELRRDAHRYRNQLAIAGEQVFTSWLNALDFS